MPKANPQVRVICEFHIRMNRATRTMVAFQREKGERSGRYERSEPNFLIKKSSIERMEMMQALLIEYSIVLRCSLTKQYLKISRIWQIF